MSDKVKGAWKCLVMVLAVAFVATSAWKISDRYTLLNKLSYLPSVCTLEYFSSLDSPLVPVPVEGEKGNILQSFTSPSDVLSGMFVWLYRPEASSGSRCVFKLFDDNGHELRQKVFSPSKPSTLGYFSTADPAPENEGFYDVRFEPLTGAKNRKFFFSLKVLPGEAASTIKARSDSPSKDTKGFLFIDGAQTQYSLIFATRHPIRWPMYKKLAGFLDFAEIPIFIGIALAALITFRFASVRAIYIVVLLAGLYTAFAFRPYCRADEDGHFDYVNAVYKEHRIPTIDQDYLTDELYKVPPEIGSVSYGLNCLFLKNRYLAVHPPLYYTVGALLSTAVSAFTKSVALRLFALRLLGVFFLLVTTGLILKTYDFLVSRQLVRRNDVLLFTIMTMFLLSPGYQTILIPVTNDQLTVPLMSLLLYLLIKYAYDGASLRLPRIFSLALLTGLLFLTKITTVYIVLPVTVLVLMRRKLKGLFSYLAIFIVLISPWLVFNYYHYGALIGTKQHLQIVSTAIGTGYELTLKKLAVSSYQFVKSYLLSYDNKYLFDQEKGYFQPFIVAWIVLICSMLIYYATKGLQILNRFTNKHKISSAPQWLGVGLLCSFVFLSEYSLLIAGTISSSTDIIMCRYTYMNVLASIFAVYIFAEHAILPKLKRNGNSDR